MGGGEVVRYLKTYGADRIAKAVLASAVAPYLYASDDNPDGGLDDATIASFETGVGTDRPAFLDGFASDFFSTSGVLGKKLKVSEAQRQYAVALALPASPKGTLDSIAAFGRTDFRADVAAVTVPTLVIHGDSGGIVPFEVSGKRCAELIPGARLHVVEGGPHGSNVSHAEAFNRVLLELLAD